MVRVKTRAHRRAQADVGGDIAGPPCQPWAPGGAQRGAEDPRSQTANEHSGAAQRPSGHWVGTVELPNGRHGWLPSTERGHDENDEAHERRAIRSFIRSLIMS